MEWKEKGREKHRNEGMRKKENKLIQKESKDVREKEKKTEGGGKDGGRRKD